VSVGTRAAFKAPSPNSRRNKLGNVNARINAEFKADVPKDAKINISLSNPKILEPIVEITTRKMFRKFLAMDICGKYDPEYARV